MLILLLAASIGTSAGVRNLLNELSNTPRQLERESTIVATLRAGLIAHEAVVHKILGGDYVDRLAFVRQKDDISRTFAEAIASFPVGQNSTALLRQAQQEWQSAMTLIGLWGN